MRTIFLLCTTIIITIVSSQTYTGIHVDTLLRRQAHQYLKDTLMDRIPLLEDRTMFARYD